MNRYTRRGCRRRYCRRCTRRRRRSIYAMRVEVHVQRSSQKSTGTVSIRYSQRTRASSPTLYMQY